MKLVQLGSDVYLTPNDVAGVYVEPGFHGYDKDRTWHDPTTWLRLRTGGQLKTDWGIDRVRYALGLLDVTWIHELWESA